MSKQKPTLVKVDWVDPSNDWVWFWLLGFRGDWVHLRGADDPDGSKHRGDSFWIHYREIRAMSDVEPINGDSTTSTGKQSRTTRKLS